MSMGRRYAYTGQLTSALSTTRASLIGIATCRPRTYFLHLSAINQTMQDYVNEYNVKRISAISSLAVTARTPTALDYNDPISAIVGGVALTGINATGEPSYTSASEVLMFSHNMHAAWAWYAPDGGEIVQPNSAVLGIGLFFIGGTSAFSDSMALHFAE